MSETVTNLVASYGWWLLALLLIAAELVLPGYFLLWVGLAAAIMGLVMLVLPGLVFLAQAVLFALLAISVCFIYWKYIRPSAEQRDDQRDDARRIGSARAREPQCAVPVRFGQEVQAVPRRSLIRPDDARLHC